MPSLLWKALAVIFLLVGFVGMLLPVLPTVPFLLLAAAAASKGWPWLDHKLVAHPVYGPMILKWRRRGAVPRRAKLYATLGMASGALVLLVSAVHPYVRWVAILTMMATGIWLWRRPED